ncbi:Retrovirus-related Pol polyprotein from transposon RE1, partial [Bienertia sinuspersici]
GRYWFHYQSYFVKGHNYDERVRSLRNNLRAKNQLGFVDGTITEPDQTSSDYAQWGIVNSMLVAWNFNTLDVSICKTVPFPDNVKILWDDLCGRYSLRNGPRIHELKAMIIDCKQRSRSVDEYYGELRTLWDELASAIKLPKCTCSAAAQYNTLLDNEKLHQFLIGLDPLKYREVASGLLMLDPLPTLSYAHGKVLSAERHQIIANSQDTRPEVVGFATEGTAPSRSNGGSDIRVCSHCGRTGHEKEKCFELIGLPEWASTGGRSGRGGGRFGGHGNGRGGGRGGNNSRQASSSNPSEVDRATLPTLTDAQVQQVIAALKTPSSTPKLHGKANVSQWIIDSGASNHMCGNIDLFCDIHDIPSEPIGLPNGKMPLPLKKAELK